MISSKDVAMDHGKNCRLTLLLHKIGAPRADQSNILLLRIFFIRSYQMSMDIEENH